MRSASGSVGSSAARPGIAAALRWWWPMLAFVLATPFIAARVPDVLPLAAAVDYAGGDWVRQRLEAVGPDDAATWRPTRDRSGHASRAVPVDSRAEFVELRACIAAAPGVSRRDVLFVSLRDGRPQLDRQYRLYDFRDTPAGACAVDRLPRLRGDDAGPAAAVLQVQLRGGELALDALTLRPLTEAPGWRTLRRFALPLGIALLSLPFLAGLSLSLSGAPTRPLLPTPTWRRGQLALGLLAVATIVFGCCVSVGLKAQIAALLGHVAVGEAQPLEALLRMRFPAGGFPLFTVGHALLFAAAALLLAPLARRAWLDLALLAVATETLQRYVPGRGPGFEDVLVDWSGLLLAALLLAALRFAQRKRLLLQQ